MNQHGSGGVATPRLRTRRVAPRLFLTAICVAAVSLPAGASAATAAGTPPDTSFSLSADFVGLFPGANLTVPVSVRNPQQYALLIKAATVSVGDASPQCVASNVTAQPFSGDVTVAAGGSTTIPVRMQMSPGAPDACQGATFPLSFEATAEVLGAQPSSGGFAFTGFGASSLLLAGLGAFSVLGGLALLAVKRRNATVVAR